MKLTFKYLLTILSLLVMISSCSDDEETLPVNTTPINTPTIMDTTSTDTSSVDTMITPVQVIPPSLSYSINSSANGASYTVIQNSSITIAVVAQKANNNSDLDVISISQNGANIYNRFTLNTSSNSYSFSSSSEQQIKNADDETFSASMIFSNISANVGVTTYTITVRDRDSVSTSKSFDIVVEAPLTPFAITKSGYFYHKASTLRSAWNISTDTTVASSSVQSGTVLSNTDLAGSIFSGGFNLSMGSSMVAAAASWDYANATVESSEMAYTAGSTVTLSSTPAIGDIYIIKMANANYIALKVTGLNATDATCTCGNTGKITFEYKKN